MGLAAALDTVLVVFLVDVDVVFLVFVEAVAFVVLCVLEYWLLGQRASASFEMLRFGISQD
jgi:hypothetical protein